MWGFSLACSLPCLFLPSTVLTDKHGGIQCCGMRG